MRIFSNENLTAYHYSAVAWRAEFFHNHDRKLEIDPVKQTHVFFYIPRDKCL